MFVSKSTSRLGMSNHGGFQEGCVCICRGKKFYKLKVEKGGSEVQQNYKEFIIPSKNFRCALFTHILFCVLKAHM